MNKPSNLYQSTGIVALITALILTVPAIAMRYTSEVNWSVADFVLMGTLIFSFGMALVLVLRASSGVLGRIAFVMAVGTTFLLIWVNLAVGLIGGGPHAGNLMYIAVIAVVVVGAFRVHFKSGGMERVMYAAAAALTVLAATALALGMQHYPGSSVTEILAVNGFFAVLFVVAGLLFREASHRHSAAD